MSRDVSQQDWATFVNYLLPDHAAGVNTGVAHRKLQAELIDERMHRLTLGEADRSMTNLEQVDAQLDPLRNTSPPQTTDRTARVQETLAEWNDGFFMPRGVKIRLIDSERPKEDETLRIPGAWIPNDNDLPRESPTTHRRSSSGWGFGGMRADSRGFRMGPIVADNNGFRIGNTLVADNNGFRMGNMVADNNGFRLGGFVADGNGLRMGGRSFGRRESNDRELPSGHGHGPGRGCGRGPHGHRGRGRSRHHGRRRGRSSSTSSSSSSSSASSADSDCSVGSLPDYDDLKEQQLPVTRQYLQNWLNNPDQPITKETVQGLKKEIKVAKETSSPKQFDQDMKALRKEVKGLMKDFKDKKKAQKSLRKERHREKKATKRAERRERKASRKEGRQARKSERKGKSKEEGRNFPPWMATRYPVPQHPETPPIPPIPSYSLGGRGFPFARHASAPFTQPPSFGRGTALHGGWPFTQRGPYAPGRVSVPDLGSYSAPVAHGAGSIHVQAGAMETQAESKEVAAMQVRMAATAPGVGEKQRRVMGENADRLEEEVEECRREAHRLRAEATHLDGELARELEVALLSS